MNRTNLLSAFFLTLVFLIAGCGKKEGSKGGPPEFAVPVKVQAARMDRIEEKVDLVGSIAANEVIEVQSETEGTIRKIHFEEGQTVDQGDLLFELDKEKLISALEEAKAAFQLAESNFKRSEELFAARAVSQQELDQARSNYGTAKALFDLARRRLEDATISAPFTGVLGPRRVSPGQVITPGTILTTLVNSDPAKVEFSIPERYLDRVRTGQEFDLHVEAFPREVFRGKVYFISPSVNQETRTALIKGSVQNPDAKLRPGMLGSVSLILETRESLVIPESAVSFRGDQTTVFVVDENQKVQPRVITLGIRLPGQVEVSEGLKPDELVVVEGIQKLRPGAKVMISPEESKVNTDSDRASEQKSQIQPNKEGDHPDS